MTGHLKAAMDRIKSASRTVPLLRFKLFTDNLVLGYSYWTKGAKIELMHLCEMLADVQFAFACQGHFLRRNLHRNLGS